MTGSRNLRLTALVVLLLAGLPLAVWLDLRSLTETALLRQTHDLNDAITGIRSYYAADVVTHPADLPIPAQFSLALGNAVSEHQHNITYEFKSLYPFRGRAPHPFDDFDRSALASLSADPSQPPIINVSWVGSASKVRLVAPIIMAANCVACHNSNPDSTKRDWKVGDVRGIQELTIVSPIATNLFGFKFLLIYFVIAAFAGAAFIRSQARSAAALARTNAMLASVSTKISKYLSPQIYASIFSGKTDATIHTQRKKLSIFFSDIKDFTSTSERLQPEELTSLLNEYFTEMSAIALRHGGTIDKFVGDAILVFFGDPESKGVSEDARAALMMALEMQRQLAVLNAAWRARGIEQPFRVRMGINTGFCNVGNFGSADRMDYTIIGAEANLAARLQSIAEPGSVVVSYETYALVRDLVTAHALEPLRVKGINRDVVPYVIDGLADGAGAAHVYSAHVTGLDLYVDPAMIEPAETERARTLLRAALDALNNR